LNTTKIEIADRMSAAVSASGSAKKSAFSPLAKYSSQPL